MDAAWGRGKYRTEVWEDDVNPVNDWWAVYAPSEEEIEAAEKGYDFSNPKDWFEVGSCPVVIFSMSTVLIGAFDKPNDMFRRRASTTRLLLPKARRLPRKN
jgi:hypothetical protein